jgi:hypothetical protein
MEKFVRTSNAYRVDRDTQQRILKVRIADVSPVRRSVGIFNDCVDEGRTAQERVVTILRGFRLGDAIPPVEVVECDPEDLRRYVLVHGTHRFYCSIAAGFTHVPAVQGF